MKQIAILWACMGFIHFSDHQDRQDLHPLYQNWTWAKYEATPRHQWTYKPSKDFGKNYGYQFRKDGTFSVCRGVTLRPSDADTEFEIVDGHWKIKDDSIIALTYKSNNRHYREQLVVRKLTEDELVVRK